MIHTLYARNVAFRYVVIIPFAMNVVHGVSKGNAKAKSPPVADDSASNVSIESHVSVPVVILPLDSQSVNIDDDLGNIQNIDSVVEIQQPQPEVVTPPPPPPPARYLTPGL